MSARSDLVQDVWRYPLFEALYGRRSRRFGLGFQITEGPFPYTSKKPPLPLSELEGGAPGGRRRRRHRHATLGHGAPRRPRRRARPDLRQHVRRPENGALLHERRRRLRDRPRRLGHDGAGGLGIRRARQDPCPLSSASQDPGHRAAPDPRRVPPLFGHNLWDSNMPGSTLFMPICDVSQSVIGLLLQLVDGEVGRFVAKHDGGMYVVDDRHGLRPAGAEQWARRGFLDRQKVLPLSILERQACYFTFNEPAVICQNIFLATEALGLGGWMHCGFLSLEVLEALGFEILTPAGPGPPPNPVGRRGVFEAYCPPFFSSMDAAVDAVVARIARRGHTDHLPPQGPTPYVIPDEAYREAIVEISDEGIACTKAICNYIHETYGRFPATVDAMHLMWFMQVHHLDLEFYEKYFKAGVCGPMHRTHMETWHV